jgi:hypothetical protein
VQEGLLAVLRQFVKENKNAQAGMKMRKKIEKKVK